MSHSKKYTKKEENERAKQKAAIAAISRQGDKSLDWSISDEFPPSKNRQLATSGVFFCCPIVSDEVLKKSEWKQRINEYLNDLLNKEPERASCLMIHTLNEKSIVNPCVETLCTYLSNLIQYDDPKYKKIRKDNKIFSSKVLPVQGSMEFLMSSGFRIKKMSVENVEQDFLVVDSCDKKRLEKMVDMLRTTEAISLQVYRDTKVLLADQAAFRVDLPSDFYIRTGQEVRKEQMKRTEELNASLQLRTRAMKERENRQYRYSLIRIRFPDNVFLQGTFGVYESLKSVRDFVREKLNKTGKFTLVNSLGRTLSESEDNKTLFDLKLLPAVLLTFVWGHESAPQYFLKPRYLKKIKSI